MTPQEKIDAIWPGSGPGCHDSTADRLRAIALAQADEIERLQRERDALLREHEAQDRLNRAVDDENFHGDAEHDLAMQAQKWHDEAARVLAEGAKK